MKTSIVLKLKHTFIFDLEKNGDKPPKMTRNTLELEVDCDDTIYSVMARLEEMTGVPPGLQMLTAMNGGSFHHDTPGTLAENNLLPTDPDRAPTVFVEYTVPSVKLEDPVLQRNTLRSLGFCVDDDLYPDESVMQELVRHGDKKMVIDVMDDIRKDGGGRRMVLVVEAGDTVADLKEEVRRRRGYPVAMQDIRVNQGRYTAERPMDKLDATLDYSVKHRSLINLRMSREFAIQADREERGKVFNKADEEIAATAPGDQK